MLLGSEGPLALAVCVKSMAYRCRCFERFPKSFGVGCVERRLEASVFPTHETARQCTTRQAHTHTAISALPTHKARAMLTCTAVHHASGTHTHRAYETALHTKFAHIRYALTSYFSWLLPHTPPQLRFVWDNRAELAYHGTNANFPDERVEQNHQHEYSSTSRCHTRALRAR